MFHSWLRLLNIVHVTYVLFFLVENILDIKGIVQYHVCFTVCCMLYMPCTLAHIGQQL